MLMMDIAANFLLDYKAFKSRLRLLSSSPGEKANIDDKDP